MITEALLAPFVRLSVYQSASLWSFHDVSERRMKEAVLLSGPMTTSGLSKCSVEVSSSSEQPQKSAAALNTTAVRAINRLMKYVFIVQFLLGMDIRYLAKDHSMTTGKWSEGYFCEYEVLTIAHDCTFVRPLVTKIWSMREALAGGVEIYL